ncbi:MAG: helix-turn-helix domain-containing protein, partial [Novosphingobium sp.]
MSHCNGCSRSVVAWTSSAVEDALMTVVAMSRGELSRYDTLLRVTRRELRVEDAATLLGLTRRQVGRLLRRLRAEGPEGLVSRRRGRPSNRRHN